MKDAQYLAQAAHEDGHWWHRGKRRIVAGILGRLAPPGSAVVEVGCGTGGNLGSLATSYRCLGFDPSEEAIALARRRFPGMRLIHGSALEVLGDLGGGADVFLLLDVLEHVEDDRGLLARIARGAKPGAHILVTVPADPRLWSPHDESLGHLRRYDRDGLRALWQDLPVTERLLSYYNTRLYPAIRLARALSRFRGRSWGSAGTDIARVPGVLNGFLEAVFSGEAPRLLKAMDGGGKGYKRGVSLMAVLRRIDENRSGHSLL